jgi:hypothetical protein
MPARQDSSFSSLAMLNAFNIHEKLGTEPRMILNQFR